MIDHVSTVPTAPFTGDKMYGGGYRDLTSGQAARLLGCSVGKIDRLCNDGMLKYYRVPLSSHRRIRYADLLRLWEETNPGARMPGEVQS